MLDKKAVTFIEHRDNGTRISYFFNLKIISQHGVSLSFSFIYDEI